MAKGEFTARELGVLALLAGTGGGGGGGAGRKKDERGLVGTALVEADGAARLGVLLLVDVVGVLFEEEVATPVEVDALGPVLVLLLMDVFAGDADPAVAEVEAGVDLGAGAAATADG